MSSPESSTERTEIVKINDYEEKSTEPIIPHERQIVDAVILIWKKDPSTESLGITKLHALIKSEYPNWSVSEKRVKTLLKKFGLLSSASQEKFTYANEIKSIYTPDIELPPKVHIVLTSKRGKGLYAKTKISKGEVIFEESQLFNVPPLSKLKLIQSGKACAYCGKLLQQNSSHAGISVLKGLDCNICSELWCSQSCKRADSELHNVLKHNVFNPNARGSSNKKKQIDANAFLELQEYAEKEQWNALYAVAIVYASILNDKTGVKGKQFRAMARVSQATRYKAINSSAGSFDTFNGGALFVQEQQEVLWNEGYNKFVKVFPISAENGDMSFDEFMYMMGTYNINNLDSCIYLTQSHLNHNCNPNTSVETSLTNRVDGLKVIAAREIRSGEELTTTYVNPAHTVQQRQRELRVNWGFICGCQKCKDDLQIQQRRKSSSGASKDKASIRDMLANAKEEVGDGIDLEIPTDYNGERRKSVRFDEKVIAVSK
ncbi:potential protein lysine methyltransferase Set5p [[Candida] railenensis]|uniref:Histone-lysine N-methyltransferase SET5 n=1 Tax=[Candida] railenensis TaxID=45579 RepID=A0A9P0QPX7_9ASCO|nr:potential protein lysine methyltransferase Set5p [[Candida] railenensis]